MDESSLRALINSLDSQQGSLGHWLDFWSFLVVVGVVAEIIFVIWQYQDDRHVWQKSIGFLRSPQPPNFVKLVLELIGVLLVSGGVAGEFLIDKKAGAVETELRKANADLVLILERDVKNAQDSANGAATAAQNAANASDRANKASDEAIKKSDKASASASDALALVHTASSEAADAQLLANTAGLNANKAQSKADAVGVQTNDLNKQLDIAKKQLADAQAEEEKERENLINLAVCNAPRVIPPMSLGDPDSSGGITKTVVDPLRMFAGRHVVIEYVPDAETHRAATSLAVALKWAGWNVDRITAVDGIRDGVSVQPYTAPLGNSPQQLGSDWESHVRAGDAATALVNFLHSYNWQAQWNWPDTGTDDIPPDGLKIRLGLAPAVVFVNPPGAKEFTEARERFKQAQQEAEDKREEQISKVVAQVLKEQGPQAASNLRSVFDRATADWKAEENRNSGPCQPLSGLPSNFLFSP